MFTFDISGQKALIKKLDALPIKMRKKIAKKATREAAKIVKQKIKAYAMANSKNGKLALVARKLTVRALKSKQKNVIGAKVSTPSREKLGIPSGNKFYYPAHIELGTRNTRPIPYMRQGLKTAQSGAMAKLIEVLTAGIEAEGQS